MTVITRFAPSPTGSLHIGSARTALYSWLYARKNNGKFILRIEDTDMERSTIESTHAIIESMHWLGLNYDEGPYHQTDRFARYRDVLNKMLEEDKAYRCYCSRERLEELRNTQLSNKIKPRYDGHCRNLNEIRRDQSFVIRFRNPADGEVIVDDQVHGKVVFKNSELDDLIIARSDGTPTYNFTVVVDDSDMQITHVIRGDDHLNNTPRQINMLLALGVKLPVYAHIPMILGSDGKRLSKRHGAVGVMQYADEGYLPEALLNYLVRLGWSHGDQEIFSRQEMIDLFDIKNLSRSAAAFNPEKLLWLNQHYIKNAQVNHISNHLNPQLEKLGLITEQYPPLNEVIEAQRERVKTLKEMAEKSRYFYADVDLSVVEIPSDIKPALQKLMQVFNQLSDWRDDSLHDAILTTAEQFDLKIGKLAQPLRLIVTGGSISPPINTTLRLLGKAKVIRRMQTLLAN